jgi:hypothetical protein
MELTEQQETEIGQELVRVLQLKPLKQFGKEFPRYETTHGNKTALGLYRTIEGIIADMKNEIEVKQSREPV